MNYAFNCFESKLMLEAGKEIECTVPVKGSKTKCLSLTAKSSLHAFMKKGQDEGFHVDYVLPEEVSAPVKQGDCVGEAILYWEGVEQGRTCLLAAQDAPRYSWWDAVRESARNWN